MKNIIATIAEIYNTRGWNAVYAYCRRNNIKYRLSVRDFASDTPRHISEKSAWIRSAGQQEFRAHFSSVSCHSRTGWRFNLLRAQSIIVIAA